MIVPDMFDSYLLIGDETALPAIAGAWKTAGGPSGPGGDRDRQPAERQALHSAAEVEVIWVVRGGTTCLRRCAA
jgi:NADPH-dependent ferric siderophore reductase